MRLKWPILRKSQENYKAQFPKLIVFVGQKSILRHCYTKNVKVVILIRVCRINKGNVTHFSQFMSVSVKKL